MDLRLSIEKRLLAFRVERRRLQARIAVIMEIEKEYEQLLTEANQMNLSQKNEEAGNSNQSPLERRQWSQKLSETLKQGEEEEASTNAKLKEFLLSNVGAEAMALDELVSLALNHGFNFGTKSAARVLHFNLLNLKNSGLLEKEGEKWKSTRNQTA